MRARRLWVNILAWPAGWRGALPVALLLVATLSCALPGAGTPAGTPGPVSIGGAASPTPPTATPTATPSVTATPTPTATPTATPTVTPLPTPSDGPYVVKQTETLGGEVISGIVCRRTQPFTVNSVAPKVSFVFVFTPQDAARGVVTYAYSIPSAGETHDAKGAYTISPPRADGTLTLSLSVSDHVVFKGFDGNVPLSYHFDLVPATAAPCP